MRVVNLGAVVVAQVVAQVDYGSRGPGFDSHWELGFFSSLSQLSISGASLIRSLMEVQYYCYLQRKNGGLAVQLEAKQA